MERRVGILFSPDVVGHRAAPSVSSRLGIERTLDELLQGTGLGYRRVSPTTFIIFQRTATESSVPVVPEILVVGRRTQNADILRAEGDIQPYQVRTGRDLEMARSDQLGVLLREQFTFDAHGNTFDPTTNRSTFNIHGLSPDETLVLVDGMRMPQIPVTTTAGRLAQPDLNALPILAIDRVEALTATSGGIYGPGATGGVINVVLKRDYRGAELRAGFGVSDRGDALERWLEGRVGFTPNEGRTDVLILLSHAAADGLRQGDRDYSTRARAARVAINAATSLPPPTSEAIVIRSLGGANLILKPALGGQALGAPYVFLPYGHGDLLSGASVLGANAKSRSEAISSANPHDRASLTPSTATASVIVSIRHVFDDRIEGFGDLVYLQNDSTTFGPITMTGALSAAAPGNPFAQSVGISFTAPGFWIRGQNHLRTHRLTGGLIARLTDDWKAELAYSHGGVQTTLLARGIEPAAALVTALSSGSRIVATTQKPTPDLLGDWDQLVDALQPYKVPTRSTRRLGLRFHDASLRLAGPVARTPAGTAFVTLAGEWRRETTRPSETIWSNAYTSGEQVAGSFFQSASSLHGELRAPIVPRHAGPRLLRGLELQAALRYDVSATTIPEAPPDGPHAWRNTTLATVLGVRLFPHEGLLLRASTATGALPPTPEALKGTYLYVDFLNSDPKRGDTPLDSDGVANLSLAGPSRVDAEKARTWSVGFVLNPDAQRLPRLSLDYTRIEKHGEIIANFRGDAQFFLDHEALFPDRVVRAPLTPADAAAGYTVGVVTGIDASAPNAGRAVIEAIDLRADQRLVISPGTVLRLYASATWTERFERTAGPDAKAISYLRSLSGPLGFRANLGLGVDHGPWSGSLTGQVYGAHGDQTVDGLSFGAAPGRVEPQSYVDINAVYRFKAEGPLQAAEAKFGIANLFDRRPPIGQGAISPLRAYSPFGDPRGRRFETSLNLRF